MDSAISVAVGSAILSGFFALNGFVLRSLSRSRLDDVFNGWKGRKRLDLLESQLRPLSLSVSFMRSLSNLTLVSAMIVIHCADGVTWPCVIVTIGISAGIIALAGVAVPFAWASYGGESILAFTFPVLLFFRYLLFPLVWVMLLFDPAIRRLCGHQEDAEDEAREEILHAAEEGRAEGAVKDSEVEMIESIVELSSTDAAEIMTPRTDILAMDAGTAFSEIVRGIRAGGHSRIPVYTENVDNIIGIVYAKDLLWHADAIGSEGLEKILRKPFFVPETKPLDELLREFKARKVHMAIVLDEYGGTAGLVTIEDVLEEIVGEIADEYDKDQEQRIRRINGHTIEIDGRVRIDELNDELELELSEQEDYDTVAGYAIAQLGYIPRAGETFSSDGADFTILDSDDRKITTLRVSAHRDDRDKE